MPAHSPSDVIATGRDGFLERVRQAARQGRQYRVHMPHDLPERVSYVGSDVDVAERLRHELEAAGARAQVVSDFSQAAEALRRILRETNARLALCWSHPMLAACGVAETLRDLGIASVEPGADRAQAFQADVGISSVDWAVAETGSLALASSTSQPPTVSLLPPLHVALVARSQILADLFDLFDRLEHSALPANFVLITGPSKTGDIELKLTTGVHGPGEVHVVIVNQ